MSAVRVAPAPAGPSAVVHRRVLPVMGTVVSLALRGPNATGAAADLAWGEVSRDLAWADQVFSTWREDSVVNRWGRGELALADAPPELAEVLALAEEARLASHGAFDIAATRSSYGGGPDPSGVVKGWAVQRAAAALERLAGTDYCLAAGGDMVCRTRQPGADPWQVGIEDPRQPTRLVATVPVANGAIATSGSARRGAHVLDPRTGRSPVDLLQVSVLAPDLTWADIDATAAFVLGAEAGEWLAGRGRAGVLVAADGTASVVG